MTSPHPTGPKRTPLHARHCARKARMGAFAGWDLPLEFSGLAAEHMAVRERAGLFDVSHMGQIEVAGPQALDLLQWVTCNNVGRLKVGQAHYSGLMTDRGTFVDDLLVYRLAAQHYLLVVNAANVEADVACLLASQARFPNVAVLDTSARYALLALQGPLARSVLQRVVNLDLSTVSYYWFAAGEIAGVRGTVSRTGYTGEDGYELFLPPAQAGRVWDVLLEEGRGEGLLPAGLGARDTLRLEAAMRLHGQDIDTGTTVLEADLEWIVAWAKPEFQGREALLRQKADGLVRKLAGFELLEEGIARAGCACLDGAAEVGRVTSGTQTPYVGKSIGLAYLPAGMARPDTGFVIDIRGRRVAARVVPLPFYKRPRG